MRYAEPAAAAPRKNISSSVYYQQISYELRIPWRREAGAQFLTARRKCNGQFGNGLEIPSKTNKSHISIKAGKPEVRDNADIKREDDTLTQYIKRVQRVPPNKIHIIIRGQDTKEGSFPEHSSYPPLFFLPRHEKLSGDKRPRWHTTWLLVWTAGII